MKTKRKWIFWALAAVALAAVLCGILFFSRNGEVTVPLSGDEAAAVLSIDRAGIAGANMPCNEYWGAERFHFGRALKDRAYLKQQVQRLFGKKAPLLVTTDATLGDLAAALAVCDCPRGVILPAASARKGPALPGRGKSEWPNSDGTGPQAMDLIPTAAWAQKFGPFDSRTYSMRWKAANALRKLLLDAGWRLARLSDGKVAIVSPADLELLFLAGSATEKEQLLAVFNQPQSPSDKQAAARLLSIFWRAGVLSDSIKSRLAPDHFPGQLGRWKFNEGTGGLAKDSSGPLQGNDGTLMDGPSWVPGRNGSALRLDGRQMVMLGNIFQRRYEEISISCWIRHGTSFWQSIVERSNWDNPDGIGLWADWQGTGVSFGHYLTGYVQSKAVVQDDRWHFVLGTMSRGSGGYIYRIYVDGKLDNSATNPIGLTSTTMPWTVGSRFDGTWRYRGEVDDVRIFNRALSADEVEKLYRE